MNVKRLILPVLLLVPLSAAAQEPQAPPQAPPQTTQATTWDPQRVEITRAGLEQMEKQYEETAASSAYSSSMREQARRGAELIRTRLTEGDFQVGDQISLVVEGEEALTSNFVVEDGPVLVLPVVGRISLKGVLRSELESHLTSQLARFIRDPVVHAKSSIRLTIEGGVGKAGFFPVATNTVFSDVLMAAGGPTKGARLDRIRIERGDQTIWENELMQRAIAEGRTIDQLGLRAGDRIIVPEKSGTPWWRSAYTLVWPISVLAGLILRFAR